MEQDREMDALVHGLASIAAVIAGVVFGDVIEQPVKRTARHWWQPVNRRRGSQDQDKGS